MSLDSKQKRGAAVNLGIPGRQWLAEPDGTFLSADRISLLAYGSAEQPLEAASLLDWLFHQPDFARKHPPRPHGGLFTACPIRPEPSLEMWEFKPPDFAKAHPPRPRGGMFAGTPVRPDPIVADWEFHQPDFAGRRAPEPVRVGWFDSGAKYTPPDPAPDLSWHPQYPDLHTYRWLLSRAWYHPALQGPFTVTDLVHVDFLRGHWSMSPSVRARWIMRPMVAGSGSTNP